MTVRVYSQGSLRVVVAGTARAMGLEAAADFAGRVQDVLRVRRKEVNVAFSGAESQQAFHSALRDRNDIAWDRLNAFAVDEFHAPGMPSECRVAAQPERDLYRHVHPHSVSALDPSAPDPESECRRYAALLEKHPLDIACLGIGRSGHVALNEPGETDFGDSRKVKVATLPPVSREQLKDDPNFRDLPAIPEIGMTVTLAELMRCPHTLLVVPFRSKAEIVRRFFESEVDPALPATIVKRKPGVVMYLDAASFALCDNLGLERLS